MGNSSGLLIKFSENASPGTRREILEMMARQLAAKSVRWKYLFNFALTDNVKAWEIVSFTYEKESGSHISQESFVYSRIAKLVATTEEWKVDESLTTKKDVVSWNRQAILAMIEAEKLGRFDLDKIERGLKAIEIINLLYPEYLLT